MKTVDRMDDMGTGALRLIVEDGGDVLVALRLPGHGPLSVEFCTPGTGGGKSPRTHKALRDLALAMQADNEADPRVMAGHPGAELPASTFLYASLFDPAGRHAREAAEAQRKVPK